MDNMRARNTRVFISYSRKDMTFADRLVAALEARNIEVKIDRRDLPLLEEWQKELLAFIQQVDAVVLIVSPNSIGSKWIEWEIQLVVELSKRLAPVVLEPVPENQIPESIRNINFVFFNQPDNFDERANALVAALNTNIIWVKEHTRIGELAIRWAERGRSAPDVLRGKQIDEAERWMAQATPNSPQPTALHAEFIQASRRAETRRWRLTAAALGLALAVTAVLGLTAYLLKRQANRERDTALTSQSRFLADQAQQSSKTGDYATALSLALEGLPNTPDMSDRPLVQEAMTALQNAAYNILEARVVSIADVLPHYGTYAIDPDGISWNLDAGNIAAATSGQGMTDNVWMLTTGPLWPWELMTAATQEQKSKSKAMEVAATSRWVVQARGDNRVQILDIATRKILADLPGHDGNAYGAALSSDGKYLVTLGQGRVRAKLWDTAKSRLIADLRGFDGGVWMAAFSENGARVITADGLNKTARIFDGKKGNLLVTLSPNEESVTFAKLSPDGTMAVTASLDGAVRLWHVDERAASRLLGKYGSVVTGGTFSPDGSRIVICFRDGAARVYSIREENAPTVLQHKARINDAEFASDSTKLVTASDDHTSIVWDVRRGNLLALLAGHREPLERACFSPDGTSVITLGASTAREWHLVAPFAPLLRGESLQIKAAAISPDGSEVVTGSEDGEALVWDARTGKKRAVLAERGWGIDTVMFSDDGKKFLTGGRDGTARLWDSEGRLVHKFKEDSGASFLAIALSGDGSKVAATSARSKDVIIWCALTFKELLRIPDPESISMKSLAFSSDSGSLLAGYLRGNIKQWNVSTGKLVARVEDVPETLQLEEVSGHNGHLVRINSSQNLQAELVKRTDGSEIFFKNNSSLRSVRVSPEGTRAAIMDITGTVHIFQFADDAGGPAPQIERKLASGAGIVRFSADGRMIAVGLESGSTYVLNAVAGTPIALLPGDSEITHLEFSRAGDRLMTISMDGLARLWHLEPTPRAFIEEALRLAPRCLDPEARGRAFLERTTPPWCVEMGKWPYRP